MWEQAWKNIIFDETKIFNMDILIRGHGFIMLAWASGSCSKGFLSWLVETWTQWWPALNKVEMLEISRYILEDWFKRLRETGCLEWIYHFSHLFIRSVIHHDPVTYLQICPKKAQKTFSSLMHWENSEEENAKILWKYCSFCPLSTGMKLGDYAIEWDHQFPSGHNRIQKWQRPNDCT